MKSLFKFIRIVLLLNISFSCTKSPTVNSWKTYNSQNSPIPSNIVNIIKIDNQNNKWIGTDYGGLSKFNDSGWTIFTIPYGGLDGNDIIIINIDEKDLKWIGFNWGVLTFDGFNWTIYDHDSLKYNNTVTSIAIDEQGIKWIGTLDGFLEFDGQTWTSLKPDKIIHLTGNFLIRAIVIDGQNTKWIATSYGTYKFDGTHWTPIDTISYNYDVLAIAIDNGGTLGLAQTMEFSSLTEYIGQNIYQVRVYLQLQLTGWGINGSEP